MGLFSRSCAQSGRGAGNPAVRRSAVPPVGAVAMGTVFPGAVDAAGVLAAGHRRFACGRVYTASLALSDDAISLTISPKYARAGETLIMGAEGDGLQAQTIAATMRW